MKAERKINRHNNPIIVEARKKAYFAGKAEGYKEGFEAGVEAGRRSLDNYINTLHNHYKCIINSIDKATNNQFTDVVLIYDPESLTFDYDEGWTTKLELGVSYSHSGSRHYESREFPPCCEMTIEKLLEVYNELLARMIKNHSREVENG